MNSPYQLLAGAILDLESHPEVKAIMSFAKVVVDRFYGDLRIAAANDKTHPVPFLLMSFDIHRGGHLRLYCTTHLEYADLRRRSGDRA